MKVARSEKNMLIFDNGIQITSWHRQDGEEDNYLDFTSFVSGVEFPDCESIDKLRQKMVLREDGFALYDKDRWPYWAQAKSYQDGGFSRMLGLKIDFGDMHYQTQGECMVGELDER